MKVVIMAGGKGTRISELFPDIPKPMIPIGGKPILEHEIESLKRSNLKEIILTVGYKKEKIIDYFGDGSRFGVNIEYFEEDKPIGSAGALFRILDRLSDDFLVLNADSLFDVDFNRFINYHFEKGGFCTIFTHPNSHPYDSGLIISDSSKKVCNWLSKEDVRPTWYKNRVNAGLHILKKELFSLEMYSDFFDNSKKRADLDRDVLKPLVSLGKLYCYDSSEYVKDMGTPERFTQVSKDFSSGIINCKNLKNTQKAVFLDRDGTLNKYVGFLRYIDDLELINGVAEAVKKINESGYLAILVTNQPVVARGEVTFEELNEIHKKLETLLGMKGAYLDGIYFCPHHPDSGFDGEVPELKIKCNCRKPNIGMVSSAVRDFNIDLKGSWFVGDSKVDVQTGKNSGCRTVLLGSTENFGQDVSEKSLLGFVERYIEEKG